MQNLGMKYLAFTKFARIGYRYGKSTIFEPLSIRRCQSLLHRSKPSRAILSPAITLVLVASNPTNRLLVQ